MPERLSTTYCPWAFCRLRIAPDGLTSMCCIQPRGTLGNIIESDLPGIWHSKQAGVSRSMISRGLLPDICNVPSCPYAANPGLRTKLLDAPYPKVPYELEIDLPMQHCNIGGENPSPASPACLMCERTTHFIRQEDRLQEVCAKIRPFIDQIRAIHIQGIAEPFWKDKIFEVLEWLGQPKQKFISTITNGTVFDEKAQVRFLEYPHTSVCCSLDAGTGNTYKKLRRVNAFGTVLKNLQHYSELRLQQQQLGILCTINLINIHEVRFIVRAAWKVRANFIAFGPTYGIPEICVNKENAELFREAQYKILDMSKESDLRIGFMNNLCLDYLPIEHPAAKPPGVNPI